MKLLALAVILLVQQLAAAPASDEVKVAVAKEAPTTTTTTTPAPTPDHTHPPHTHEHTHPPHTHEHTHEHVHTPDCKKDGVAPPGTGEYYDQRQNGTHNIRVEIDNIVILHAPLDIGSDASEGDEEIAAFLTQLTQLAEAEAANKDKPPTIATVEGDDEKDKDKPAVVVKTQKKNRTKVRLASLLGPLLRHHA